LLTIVRKCGCKASHEGLDAITYNSHTVTEKMDAEQFEFMLSLLQQLFAGEERLLLFKPAAHMEK